MRHSLKSHKIFWDLTRSTEISQDLLILPKILHLIFVIWHLSYLLLFCCWHFWYFLKVVDILIFLRFFYIYYFETCLNIFTFLHLTFDMIFIWRLAFDICCFSFDICHLIFEIWPLIYDIWHLSCDIWNFIYDIWHLTWNDMTWYSSMTLTWSQLIFTDGFCGYHSNLQTFSQSQYGSKRC